jgi:hypothetical protein
VTFVTLAAAPVLVLVALLVALLVLALGLALLVLALGLVLLEFGDPLLQAAAVTASRAAPATPIVRHRNPCPMAAPSHSGFTALKVRVPLTVSPPFGSRNAGNQEFFMVEQVTTFILNGPWRCPSFRWVALGGRPNGHVACRWPVDYPAAPRHGDRKTQDGLLEVMPCCRGRTTRS